MQTLNPQQAAQLQAAMPPMVLDVAVAGRLLLAETPHRYADISLPLPEAAAPNEQVVPDLGGSPAVPSAQPPLHPSPGQASSSAALQQALTLQPADLPSDRPGLAETLHAHARQAPGPPPSRLGYQCLASQVQEQQRKALQQLHEPVPAQLSTLSPDEAGMDRTASHPPAVLLQQNLLQSSAQALAAQAFLPGRTPLVGGLPTVHGSGSYHGSRATSRDPEGGSSRASDTKHPAAPAGRPSGAIEGFESPALQRADEGMLRSAQGASAQQGSYLLWQGMLHSNCSALATLGPVHQAPSRSPIALSCCHLLQASSSAWPSCWC